MSHEWNNEPVRDLAWVIGSPELVDWTALGLASPPNGVWSNRLKAATDALMVLDEDPSPLLEHLALRPTYRLGIYFEQLLRFWFQFDESPELLLQNLPIRSAERTLGELDFVVRNEGAVEHWEVGVKYYLGYRGTGSADAWIGPGCKDSLGRKMRRMMSHQLPMVRVEETVTALRERGIEVSHSRAVLKGFLFFPMHPEDRCAPPTCASQGHLRGVWARQSELLRLEELSCTRWWPLEKIRWMGGPGNSPEGDGFSVAELPRYAAERLERDDQRPFMIAGLDPDRKGPQQRCFVVPNDWPQRLPESKTASA